MRSRIKLALVASLVLGCKPYHAPEAGADLKADEGSDAVLEPARDLASGRPVENEALAFRDLEVVDCPKEICTPDTELVEATPEGANQLVVAALGNKNFAGGEDVQFALAGNDGASSFEDVSKNNASLAEAFANGGVDGLRAVSALLSIGNTVSQLEGQTSREKVASAKAILAALRELDRSQGPEFKRALLQSRADLAKFKPLKGVVSQLGDDLTDEDTKRFLNAASGALGFFRDNLVATTDEGKLKILEAMLDAIPQEFLGDGQGAAPNSLTSLGDAKTAALIQAARRFAGKDGYVNRGDAVRILPVVPKLVAEVADQMIADGFAQGMAKLASEHPFVYRRWMKRPNGVIGRAVNKGIGKAMSMADAAKWDAVRQAGAATQKMYDDLMGDLGVKRYYLGLEADADHWDPDAELTTPEIRSLVQVLTGMTVEGIGAKMVQSRGAGAGDAQANAAKIKGMVGKLRFPDGVPVDDVVTMLEAYRAGGEVKIPHGMDFRLGNDGKVEVVRHHQRCECYFEPQVKACILTFMPAGDKTLRFYSSSVPSNGTCEYKTQCHENFVKAGRAVNLMKACGQTFQDRATGNVYIYGGR